jgi:2-polyprenyl-6-hydroxyphenyl methylase / 3-demethylubiquinone-9 3-methyltransferase
LHALEAAIDVAYRLEDVAETAAREPASFDVVTCMELLEHVPDPSKTVAACAALLRPDGLAVFSTINRSPKSYLFAVIGAEYVLRLLPRGTHDYARFIRPSELSRHARDAGLAAIAMTGMTYNPLARSYRLEPDTSVNYILACRKSDA